MSITSEALTVKGDPRYLEEIPEEYNRSIFDVIRYEDGNLHIAIPEDLGGGEFVEEDYELTNYQLELLDSLLMKRRVNAEVETNKGLVPTIVTVERAFSDESSARMRDLEQLRESPKFNQEGIAAVSASVAVWEALETLRIVRPLADHLTSAIQMGHDVSQHQLNFLTQYDRIAGYAERISEREADEESIERRHYVFSNLEELDRRRDGGLLYNDGSEEDTYLQRQRERRLLDIANSRDENYFETRIGRTLLAIMSGDIKPEDITEAPDAIAVIHAIHDAGASIIKPNHLGPFLQTARRVLGKVSTHVADEARTPRAPVAHAKLTTGEGDETLTRPKPGV